MKEDANIDFTGHILIKDDTGKVLVNKRTVQPEKEKDVNRLKDPYKRKFNNKG